MRKRTASQMMAAAILLCALTGVAIKMGVFQGQLGLHQLRYFTTLSNLLAAACAGWALCRGRGGYAWAKGLSLICILVTGTVYHMLLAGSFGGFAPLTLGWWGNELVHTVVPVLCALDYLLFDTKGRLNWRCPLVWMLAPCGYFAMTVAIARAGIKFPGSHTAYPYPFLDVWTLGWGPVLRSAAMMAAGFLALGYVLVALDRLLEKKSPAEAA